jgi:predicted transglutaminase-like cysteine proteinase
MGSRIVVAALGMLSFMLIRAPAFAEQNTSRNDSIEFFAPTGKSTAMPIGWKLFCDERPRECAPTDGGAAAVKLTQANWAQLVIINDLANVNIEGVADDEHYDIYRRNIPNWWTFPDDGKGNCNDYVMLKKKLLIEAGWPKSALLLTVVLDHEKLGHLVLTVRTDRGDLILDNMNARIVRWSETGYVFIKRQSPTNPNIWVAIDPQQYVVGSASSSVR